MNKDLLISTAYVFKSFITTKDDWQKKIDVVVEQYHKGAKHLPRKQKKQAVKKLNSDYKFFKAMQSFNPFNEKLHL